MTQLAANQLQALGHARPPTWWDRLMNNATRMMAASFAVGMLLLLAYILYVIGWAALPVAKSHGLEYLSQSTYDPAHSIHNKVTEYGYHDRPQL